MLWCIVLLGRMRFLDSVGRFDGRGGFVGGFCFDVYVVVVVLRNTCLTRVGKFDSMVLDLSRTWFHSLE